MCVWLRVEAGQRRLWTCTLHGDGPRSAFPTLSDGPPNTDTSWAAPLYKGVGPTDNQTNGVFMVYMPKTVQTTVWGHNSQFYWTSARVKCTTCLFWPLYLIILTLAVLLFWPHNKSFTTAPSSGLVTVWRYNHETPAYIQEQINNHT